MKIQRRVVRTVRSSDPASLPISDDVDSSGNGSHAVENGAAEVEAHVHVEEESINGTTETATASNGAKEQVAAANGSNGSHTPVKSPPTLPKRRRSITPTETEVVAKASPSPAGRSRLAAGSAVVAAPAAPVESDPRPAWRFLLTYENLFWVAVFATAIFTRFWDLGSRGIHHDESLHANFSYVLYIGNGYVHDPMMHGPLQFHLISFMFWLFGATDATARFASVFSGIFVVMSPFFLRRQMGRVPAMVAAFLLLISPGILYFSRMAREDSIFSAMEMIMLVGLWRFISMRKPGDFILFCAGLSLMFTIKETAFLTAAILGIFFLVLFAYQAGYAILAALGGYLVAAGGFFMFVNSGMKAGTIAGLPNIPNPGPDTNIIMTFANKFVTHPLIYGEVLLFALFVLAVVFLLRMQRNSPVATAYSDAEPIRRRARPAIAPETIEEARAQGAIPSRAARASTLASTPVSANGKETRHAHDDEIEADNIQRTYDDDAFEAQEVWDASKLQPAQGSVLGRYQPGSIPHLIGALFSRPRILLIGFLVFSVIFLVFYTVFFTDIPRGILSGVFASLGYWMGQHDVRRGDQPWFYYFLLIPLYEPVAVFFSLVGTIFFSWRGVRWLMRRRNGELRRGEAAPRTLGLFNTDRPVPFASFSAFLPLFLIVWLVGTVGVYSWAGEKMPWLMMHMTRPAIFLSALFIGALIVSLLRRRRERLAAEAAYNTSESFEEVATPVSATGSNGVPARRRTSAARAPQPVYYDVQEPPWVTWSKPGSRFPLFSFLISFVVLVMSWGLLMNALGFKAKFDPSNYGNFGAWGWTWAYPLAIIAMVVGYAVWIGPGRALRYLGLGILAVGLMYQFRSAVNLAYNQPDVSTELASYVQTSPDVTRVMNEIETFANYSTTGTSVKGGNDIKIMYDSFTSWPMEWYLRDYNKTFIGGGEPQPGSDVPILLLEYNKYKDRLNFLPNYVGQRYAMRWWFPQEWYMNEFLPTTKQGSATAQIGEAINTISLTVTRPQFQSTLWKYLIFRDPPKPLGSEDMILYLRRDIAQMYHRLQYTAPQGTDVDNYVQQQPPQVFPVAPIQ